MKKMEKHKFKKKYSRGMGKQRLRVLVFALLISLLCSVTGIAGQLYSFDPNQHPIEIYPHYIVLWHEDSSLGFDFFYVDESTMGKDVFDRWLAVILTAQSLNKSFQIHYSGQGIVESMYTPK